MRYENQRREAGWGRILDEGGSKSVTVFYVLYSAEVYAGSRDPVRMPDELSVEEFDFRGKDRGTRIREPAWVKREGATLETKDGKSYRISWEGYVGWRISRTRESAEGDKGDAAAK